MPFTKEHLNGFYKWMPEAERSIFDGNATRRLFDRFNGNQILFIINLIMDSCGNYSVDLGKKIESDCPQAKDRKGGYISFHDLLIADNEEN